MRKGRGTMVFAAALLVCCMMASPAPAVAPPSLLANPGAESGDTSGWQSEGFEAVEYGSSPAVAQLSFSEAMPEGFSSPAGLGSWLFVAERAGARMAQTVSLESLAPQIDEGHQPFVFDGWLGGSGAEPDGVQASAQFLDARGQPLGAATLLGPPTAADREATTTMLNCYARTEAPVGARSARITLLATGPTGTADELYFSADSIGETGAGPAPGAESWWTWKQDEDSHCRRWVYEAIPPDMRTPPVPPAPATSPATTTAQASVRISDLRLTRRRLSMWFSDAATARVTLERRIARGARHHTRPSWRTQASVTIRAAQAGIVASRLGRVLPAGQYRLTVTIVRNGGQHTTFVLAGAVK